MSNQFVTFTTHGALPKETTAVANTSYPTIETALEQAQYVNNKHFKYQENQLPNNYHLDLCNHDNLSYGNYQNVLQPPPRFANQQVEEKSSVKDLLAIFITETRDHFK